MASLRRVPRSSHFIACYTGADGKRYQRSTGVKVDGKVDSRRQAQKIANEFEDVARRKRTAQQVQRVFREIYEEVTSAKLPDATVRDFGDRWLASKKAEVSDATHVFYDIAYRKFIKHLGPKANRAMFEVTKDEIQRWRDSLAKKLAPTTVNHNLKFVRMLFAAAKRESIVADNPAEDVPVLKRTVKTTRRPFTLAELRAMLKAADTEWRSMILFGLYTGQRLGDIARLSWDQVDLEAREIRLQTSKTGRHQKIPIPPPLLKHITRLKKKAGEPYLHPKAEDIVATQGKTGSLSVQFHKLMAKAKIVEAKKHRKTTVKAAEDGKPKDRKGEAKVSFHSLRHTTTSLLKNAGVSAAIAEEFVGHDSAEMNRVYTHIELKTMKKAAGLLPDVTLGL
jgi:integrase